MRAAFAASSRMAHGGAVQGCCQLTSIAALCVCRSFAPMAGALPPDPEASSHGHAVECGKEAEPGATPRERGHDRDRERQAHAVTVTAHDHGRGSRMCDSCLIQGPQD